MNERIQLSTKSILKRKNYSNKNAFAIFFFFILFFFIKNLIKKSINQFTHSDHTFHQNLHQKTSTMSLTPEEMQRLRRLNSEIMRLSAQCDSINANKSGINDEINNLRKEIFETVESAKRHPSKRQTLPKKDQQLISKKKAPRKILSNEESLFLSPPTPDEKYRTGRVKYVRDKNEMISYPKPGEYMKTGGRTLVTTSIFFNFKPGQFSNMTTGNAEFPNCNAKFEERPSMQKYLVNKKE